MCRCTLSGASSYARGLVGNVANATHIQAAPRQYQAAPRLCQVEPRLCQLSTRIEYASTATCSHPGKGQKIKLRLPREQVGVVAHSLVFAKRRVGLALSNLVRAGLAKLNPNQPNPDPDH